MEPVVVTDDFKIEIPEDVRNRMNIVPGAKFHVIDLEGVLRMVPVVDVRSLRGKFPGCNAPLERDEDRV